VGRPEAPDPLFSVEFKRQRLFLPWFSYTEPVSAVRRQCGALVNRA
jgi:hypothetical protein